MSNKKEITEEQYYQAIRVLNQYNNQSEIVNYTSNGVTHHLTPNSELHYKNKSNGKEYYAEGNIVAWLDELS